MKRRKIYPVLLFLAAGLIPAQLFIHPAASVLVGEEVGQRRRRPEGHIVTAASAASNQPSTGNTLPPFPQPPLTCLTS